MEDDTDLPTDIGKLHVTGPGDEAPVNVPLSATPAQLKTAAQYIVASLGMWAVGRGYIQNDTLAVITAVLTTVVPLALGVWRATHNQQKLLKIVTSPDTVVPDTVAKVK